MAQRLKNSKQKSAKSQSNASRASRSRMLSSARVYLQDFAHEFSVFTGAISGRHPMGFAEYEDKLVAQEARERKARLYELRLRKWIETKKIGERLLVRLTKQGWQRALRDQIRCTSVKCKDGICIVVFDVPESERHVRDALREILQSCNFTMLQKSVWVSRKDIIKPLCALLQGAKLERWVRILVGKELTSSFLRRTITRAQASTASAIATKKSRS